MIQPRRAPVQPRVFPPGSGIAILLEDVVRDLLASGIRGIIELGGPIGSGKTSALQHLAAVLPPDAAVRLLDDFEKDDGLASEQLVVRSVLSFGGNSATSRYRLAPWGDDDLIEYLLSVHRDRCASVISRLTHTDRYTFGGAPELWTVALDQLAADDSLANGRAALALYLGAQLNEAEIHRARGACLIAVTSENGSFVVPPSCDSVWRVLRHPQIQLVLSAERVIADLRTGDGVAYLAERLPRPLVTAVAEGVVGCDSALARLRELLETPSPTHAMAASILHAADPGWMPTAERVPNLAGAYLDGVAWEGVQLPAAHLGSADFSGADLGRATLRAAVAEGACFRNARLRGANLATFHAANADLSGADLASVAAPGSVWDGADLESVSFMDAELARASFRGADCTACVFVGANLAGAAFPEALLEGADFRGANLHKANLSRLKLRDATFADASFDEADLSGCDMEGMDLPGTDFRRANLVGALLTGARLSHANFRNAYLVEAGLGDVDMEGACLAGANLRGATFHMGSTRSGLLFTPIASEGTRTGFYTDDADEQNFKSPEEIRKANLRGTDLRGAYVADVDFYLVDLRDALYDADQEKHFRRCRAILEYRCGGTD
jgi:uncharacterized protein YjbI with pentapeptide repeats